jgi:Mediator complex subunit 16
MESGGLSSEMSVQAGSLCGIRSSSRARVADIGFDANGGILVVTSDGSITSPIKCHRVELGHNLHRSNSSVCTVNSSPVASFFAHCHTIALMREAPTAKVTHVRYVERNSDGHMLLVGAGDDNGSHIELWQLTNRQVNIHKFFHSPDTVIPPSVKVGSCS